MTEHQLSEAADHVAEIEHQLTKMQKFILLSEANERQASKSYSRVIEQVNNPTLTHSSR